MSLRVTIIDASTGSVITTLPASNVYEVGFSPRGTFIVTWERPGKDQEGNATKNLTVWRVIGAGKAEDEGVSEEKTVVGKFVQRSQSGWNLQYTSDEQYCARMVTNEVQFYKSDDLASVWKKLRVEGVLDFALSPGNHHSLAVFIPERKVRSSEGGVRAIDADISRHKGSTSGGEGLQRSGILGACFSEDVLQRRQGATEME